MMRTTTAAWFLPVSLAAVLAAVTNVSVLAYQGPGSPTAGRSQVPGPSGLDAGAPGPGMSSPSRSSNAATLPRASAASATRQSPGQFGPVQQEYSTAWSHSNFTPARRSTYGGAGSAAANLPLPPTGRAAVNRYPTPLGTRGGGSSFTSQAAARAMSGSRPSARAAGSPKAFSDYSRKSAVSPYMNLFRTDNQFGDIDNYNTLVKPMLRQRQMNRQTQWGLRTQGNRLRELNRRTGSLQGISQQSSFRNYLDYYPALNR